VALQETAGIAQFRIL